MEANLFSTISSISKRPIVCVPSDIGFGYGYQEVAIKSAYNCKYPIGVFNVGNIWGACNYCANYVYSKNIQRNPLIINDSLTLRDYILNTAETCNKLKNNSGIIVENDDPQIAIVLGAIIRDCDLKIPIIATGTSGVSGCKKEMLFKTIINNCVNNVMYVDNINYAKILMNHKEEEEKLMMTNEELFKIEMTSSQLDDEIKKTFDKHVIHVKKLINDPLQTYNKYISSPEFTEVLSTIIEYLILSIKKIMTHENSMINDMCRIKLMNLYNVQYLNNYAYISTLNAILSSIELFEILERRDNNTIGVYYHFLNYKYYFDKLIEDDCFIFPTIYNKLGSTDIINIRSVPVFFCGITAKSVYVDEFWQSPLEFFIHDINHSRRMYQYSKFHLMEESAKFTSEIIEFIKLKKEDSDTIKAHKQLMKMLLFEIVHEDALYMLPEIIWDALHRDTDYVYIFERTVLNDGKLDVVKQPIKVEGAMAYTKYKLQYQFYDHGDSKWVVDSKYRTVTNIVNAAMLLLKFINVKFLPDKKILEYSWYLSRACHCKYIPPPVHEYKVEGSLDNFDTTGLKTGISQTDYSEGYRRVVGEHDGYKNILEGTNTSNINEYNEELIKLDRINFIEILNLFNIV